MRGEGKERGKKLKGKGRGMHPNSKGDGRL